MSTTLAVETRAEAPRRVGWGFIVAYAAAYAGIFVGLLSPIVVTMFSKLGEMGLNGAKLTGALSLILGTGALFSVIGNPLFGKISDRTTSRFGRRRPWMIMGVLGALLGLGIIGFSSNVWIVMMGWWLVVLSYNATLAAVIAVLPDQVPKDQRGLVGGALGIGVAIASTVGTFVVASMPGTFWKLVVPGLIALVLVGILAAVLKDQTIRKEDVPPFTAREFLQSFYVNPVKAPDFSWAWWGRLLLFMGVMMLLTMQGPYLLGHLHVPAEQIQHRVFTATLVQSIVLIVVGLVGGRISDRLGRRKAFVFGSAVLYGVGLAVIAFASSFETFLVGMAITGAAQGLYLAVDLALVVDILPSAKTAARDLGVFNMASSLAQSLAPAIAPVFLIIGGGGNFVALFAAAAVFAVLGALAIIPIRGVK